MMESTIAPFTRCGMAVSDTIFNVLEQKLGLPAGALGDLHDPRKHSMSESRCVRTPPNQPTAGIGAHTDFGSLVSYTFPCVACFR